MENSKELVTKENNFLIDVPSKFENAFKQSMDLVGSIAFNDEARQMSLMNILSSLDSKLTVDKGTVKLKPNQISNKEQLYAFIGHAGLCKVSDTSKVYMVSYKDSVQRINGESVQMYNVTPSLNYLEEERILKDYSNTFESIQKITLIDSNDEFGKDWEIVNEVVEIKNSLGETIKETREKLVMHKSKNPFTSFGEKEIKSSQGFVVTVLHKDSTTKDYFIKSSKIMESFNKSHGKTSIYVGGYKEDMFEKLARRSVYKFYNISLDSVVADSFAKITNDIDYGNGTELERDVKAKVSEKVKAVELEEISMDSVEEIVEIKEDETPKVFDAEIIEKAEVQVEVITETKEEVEELPQQEETLVNEQTVEIETELEDPFGE